MQGRQSIQDSLVPGGHHLHNCYTSSVPSILVILRFLLQRCLHTSVLSPRCALIQECLHLHLPFFKAQVKRHISEKKSASRSPVCNLWLGPAPTAYTMPMKPREDACHPGAHSQVTDDVPQNGSPLQGHGLWKSHSLPMHSTAPRIRPSGIKEAAQVFSLC